jgi:hypothetical protein
VREVQHADAVERARAGGGFGFGHSPPS